MKVYRSERAKRRILNTYDQLLAQWGVETEEKDIDTYYGTTHVVCCGSVDNPPLVLFHGVGDDAALMWLYNAKPLAAQFRLYALDTMGGPGKSRPNTHYDRTYDDVRWIDETLNGLGLTQTFVAGVSNGAYLTQLYGLRRPERVRGMVCMAGSVPVGSGSPIKTMIKIFFPEALFPTKRNTLRLIRKLCGSNSRVFTDHPLVIEHYRALLKGFNNMAMGYHHLEHFSDADVDAIRDKALYLMGEADPFALLGGKAALLDHQMNAKFYPDTGHGINHERTDAVNQEIIRYFLPAAR
ncbi:MAG TPA: alpha/beta hydrolase [Candidatus Limiplasma sp.]|nr:alpha/beta hydrolase [Candidatus Limiplasma sp.]